MTGIQCIEFLVDIKENITGASRYTRPLDAVKKLKNATKWGILRPLRKLEMG